VRQRPRGRNGVGWFGTAAMRGWLPMRSGLSRLPKLFVEGQSVGCGEARRASSVARCVVPGLENASILPQG